MPFLPIHKESISHQQMNKIPLLLTHIFIHSKSHEPEAKKLVQGGESM